MFIILINRTAYEFEQYLGWANLFVTQNNK